MTIQNKNNCLTIDDANHMIIIRDKNIDNYYPASDFWNLKDVIYDFFDNDKEYFQHYKNAGFGDMKKWEAFVNAGDQFFKQLQKDGLANKLKSSYVPVVLLDVEYFKNKHDEAYKEYQKAGSTSEASKEFNKKMLKQMEELTETMSNIVKRNEKTAKDNNVVLPEPKVEDTKERTK